jgi:hypothetical protein
MEGRREWSASHASAMQKNPVPDVISAFCKPVSLPSRTDLERTYSFSFVYLSRNPHDIEKRVPDIKTCLWCSSTTSAWKISSSDKYFVSYHRDKSRNACRSRVKCELLLWDFNQIWNLHILVSETLQLCRTFENRWTERRDEVNTVVSQLQTRNRQENCTVLWIAIKKDIDGYERNRNQNIWCGNHSRKFSYLSKWDLYLQVLNCWNKV